MYQQTNDIFLQSNRNCLQVCRKRSDITLRGHRLTHYYPLMKCTWVMPREQNMHLMRYLFDFFFFLLDEEAHPFTLFLMKWNLIQLKLELTLQLAPLLSWHV